MAWLAPQPRPINMSVAPELSGQMSLMPPSLQVPVQVPEQNQPDLLQALMGSLNPMAMVTPEQQAMIQAERQNVKDLGSEAMNMRRGSIEQMRQDLLDYKKQPKGVDFTGAAMLVDQLNSAWSKPSNLTYQYLQSGLRPESENQRQGRIVDLTKAIDRAEQGALDAEVRMGQSNLKNLKDQVSGSAMTNAAKQQAINKRFMSSQLLKNFREDQKFLDKVSNEAETAKNDLVFVEDALDSGEIGRIMQATSKMARLAGEKGALAQSDVDRQFFKTLDQQIRLALGKLDPKEKADPRVIQQVQNAMATMRKAASKMFSGRLNSRVETMKQNPLYSLTATQTEKAYGTMSNKVQTLFGTDGDDQGGQQPSSLWDQFQQSRGGQ